MWILFCDTINLSVRMKFGLQLFLERICMSFQRPGHRRWGLRSAKGFKMVHNIWLNTFLRYYAKREERIANSVNGWVEKAKTSFTQSLNKNKGEMSRKEKIQPKASWRVFCLTISDKIGEIRHHKAIMGCDWEWTI